MTRKIFLMVALVVVGGCSKVLPTSPSTVSWLGTASLPLNDPRFDLPFYNALVHGSYEFGTSTPLHRLMQSPSIYLQRTGLNDEFVKKVEQTFREEIPNFTGNALTMGKWETGNTLKADEDGWIVIELGLDAQKDCGLTKLGAAAGHMWINMASKCLMPNGEPFIALLAHELGHALGFYHVERGLMQPVVTFDQQLTNKEQFHGAVAYTQGIGSK